jgi:hypothetical protein
MQNDPQDENRIKKALRTWRALREIKIEKGLPKKSVLSFWTAA